MAATPETWRDYINALYGCNESSRLTKDKDINDMKSNYEGLLKVGFPRDITYERYIKLGLIERDIVNDKDNLYSIAEIRELHEEMKNYNAATDQSYNNLADFLTDMSKGLQKS